jgi:hypothetical protein
MEHTQLHSRDFSSLISRTLPSCVWAPSFSPFFFPQLFYLFIQVFPMKMLELDSFLLPLITPVSPSTSEALLKDQLSLISSISCSTAIKITSSSSLSLSCCSPCPQSKYCPCDTSTGSHLNWSCECLLHLMKCSWIWVSQYVRLQQLPLRVMYYWLCS